MLNERDPRNDLGAFLGEELRRAREDAGINSQDMLARELGYSRTVIVKAETGSRPPSREVAARIAERFPNLCNGMYITLAAIAREENGPIPGWFADWLEREGQAASIRIYQPVIVPGVLQTADYARALFEGGRLSIDDGEVDELVEARAKRQGILEKRVPPPLWVVIDELVLHRLIGTPKVMHDQLVHLADLSERPNVSIQVVPVNTGAYPGLVCAFMIASTDSQPEMYLIEAVEDVTATDDALVAKAAIAFDHVRGAALSRAASRELILKLAEEKWDV